jgi:hypothetical protein
MWEYYYYYCYYLCRCFSYKPKHFIRPSNFRYQAVHGPGPDTRLGVAILTQRITDRLEQVTSTLTCLACIGEAPVSRLTNRQNGRRQFTGSLLITTSTVERTTASFFVYLTTTSQLCKLTMFKIKG